MKKITKLFLALCMISLVILTACTNDVTKSYKVIFETNGGSKINTIAVKENSELKLPTDPSKTGYEFVGWYLDEELEEELPTPYVVTKNVTIYAKWEQVKQEIEILVNTVSQRYSFETFNLNKSEKENKRKEFFDLTTPYLVGDDNPFKLAPTVTFASRDVKTGTIISYDAEVESWNYVITVKLDGEDVTTSEYVEAIDKVNCSVDFSDKAIDKEFVVEVYPEGLTEKQITNISKYTTVMTCKVGDGYNVYEAKELGYLDNRTTGAEGEAWTNFKEENKMNVNYVASNIYLHNDINVTSKSLPSYFFYSEEEVKGAADYSRALGSLKDFTSLYQKTLNENEMFGIYGNYFTLNTSEIPMVVRENGKITDEGKSISHSQAFYFNGAESSTVRMEGINFVGNAPRVEDMKKAGGLICMKVETQAFVGYNNISTGWYISYFANGTSKRFEINKCKAYDAYNSFIYSWGSGDVHVIDSEMIGAGGPIVIQDHYRPGDVNERISKTYFENCVLESYVAGTEGWFTSVNATAAASQIKSLDAAFNPFKKSILKESADGTTYFNCIVINKASNSEGPTAIKCGGLVQIDDGVAFDYGANDPYIKGLIDTTFGYGAPALQTSKGTTITDVAYIGQTGIVDYQNQQIVDPTHNIFQGDYICIYFNGMAIVLGYNNYGTSHELYTPEK